VSKTSPATNQAPARYVGRACKGGSSHYVEASSETRIRSYCLRVDAHRDAWGSIVPATTSVVPSCDDCCRIAARRDGRPECCSACGAVVIDAERQTLASHSRTGDGRIVWCGACPVRGPGFEFYADEDEERMGDERRLARRESR
jgi:hypothetical protein